MHLYFVQRTEDETVPGAALSPGRSAGAPARLPAGLPARIVFERSRAWLVIGGDFGVKSASGIAAIGTELLRTHGITALLLDLSAVTAIDADGLATLSRWSDVGRVLRKPIRLCATSAAVRRALATVG